MAITVESAAVRMRGAGAAVAPAQLTLRHVVCPACNLEYSGIAILSQMLTPGDGGARVPLAYLQLDRAPPPLS